MPIVIALIRGINVGGHKKIKMADLRQLFTSLGLRQVRTVLQSGNAVFAADESDLPRLQKQLEAAMHVNASVLRRGCCCARRNTSKPLLPAIPSPRPNSSAATTP